MTTVFIISGGSVQKDFAKDFINKTSGDNKLIIACDKGYEHCISMNIKPDITIGDFDSISKDKFELMSSSDTELIKLNPIKDDTDTEAALNIAIDKTTKKDCVYILGATGTRLDHVIGNISLIGLGLKKDRTVVIVDENNYIRMIKANESITISKKEQFGKYISVFPYGGIAEGVSMTGFKYPLEKAIIKGFNTLTVSNEIVDEAANISLDKGYLIICETRD